VNTDINSDLTKMDVDQADALLEMEMNEVLGGEGYEVNCCAGLARE